MARCATPTTLPAIAASIRRPAVSRLSSNLLLTIIVDMKISIRAGGKALQAGPALLPMAGRGVIYWQSRYRWTPPNVSPRRPQKTAAPACWCSTSSMGRSARNYGNADCEQRMPNQAVAGSGEGRPSYAAHSVGATWGTAGGRLREVMVYLARIDSLRVTIQRNRKQTGQRLRLLSHNRTGWTIGLDGRHARNHAAGRHRADGGFPGRTYQGDTPIASRARPRHGIVVGHDGQGIMTLASASRRLCMAGLGVIQWRQRCRPRAGPEPPSTRSAGPGLEEPQPSLGGHAWPSARRPEWRRSAAVATSARPLTRTSSILAIAPNKRLSSPCTAGPSIGWPTTGRCPRRSWNWPVS